MAFTTIKYKRIDVNPWYSLKIILHLFYDKRHETSIFEGIFTPLVYQYGHLMWQKKLIV